MEAYLKSALVDTKSRLYYIVSDFLAALTVVSIAAIVLETVPSLSKYSSLFWVVEWAAVVFFTMEYVARLYIIKPSRSYIFSFLGLIDLVSILPTFLGLGNFTFLKSARAIRLIRLLRMVRMAKIKHLNVRDVEEKMSFFAVNILLFLVVVLGSTLVVGTLMYLVEGTNEAFSTIPLAMFWSFKVFLIGIPIAYPETLGGELGHIFARLVGLTVFGVLVGLIGNVIKDWLFVGK